MNTRIAKWGNSLAIRIPSSFAEEAGVSQGCLVDLTLDQGNLVIRPVQEGRIRLDVLLEQITDENLHEEIEAGPPVGREFGA